MANLYEDKNVAYWPVEPGYLTIDDLDTIDNRGFVDELFETGRVIVTYEGSTYELTLTMLKVTLINLSEKVRDAL